jgi:hypothetical protein
MIWLPDGDEILDREKQMIQSSKLMLTFVRNPHGFQVVDTLPKREMYAAAYNIRKFLAEIIARRRVERDVKGSWLSMHASNARPIQHKSETHFANTISCELHDIHATHRTELLLTFSCFPVWAS